jgi:flagellar hook-associated protein 1 FlgK
MGGLFASLHSAADALSVYERALTVSQNNITNANTPGYAKQRLQFQAKSFDPAGGLNGGVIAGPVVSSRDPILESSVRQRSSDYGRASQNAATLNEIEPILSITDGAAIPSSLSTLFQSFSALSVTPNDTSARQSVLDAAAGFASAMNSTASQLSAAAGNAWQQASAQVSQINDLASRIQSLNSARRQAGTSETDAGVGAQMNSLLEELSQIANVSVLNQQDGTVSVYLGGLTPLVLGDNAYAISANQSAGGAIQLRDSQGQNITGYVKGGSLAGLLDAANTQIPSYLDGLHRLAASVADQVNTTLVNGVDQNGQTPVQNLFSYNSPSDAAATLSVNALTPDQLAAATADAPGGNGNALALADLGSTAQLDGVTFSAFYGSVAGSLGRDLATSQESSDTQQSLLDQSKSLREQTSGVSIDEEATRIMEMQRAYQATAQMITVLNSLTETVLGMIQP